MNNLFIIKFNKYSMNTLIKLIYIYINIINNKVVNNNTIIIY